MGLSPDELRLCWMEVLELCVGRRLQVPSGHLGHQLVQLVEASALSRSFSLCYVEKMSPKDTTNDAVDTENPARPCCAARLYYHNLIPRA